jgi:hypothetical protein
MARARFWDPAGERFGLPTYPWRMAPDHLLTRSQLRSRDLRPGGQPVAAQVLWMSRLHPGAPRAAYLYRLELARPVRPMTPAKTAALAAAMTARRTCPSCLLDAGYVLPTRYGTCLPCADGIPLAA